MANKQARDVLGRAEEVDHVPGDAATTAWKRAARAHQNRWRQLHGWPPGLRPGSEADESRRLIGSRVDFDFAKRTNANFLHPGVATAVEQRVANPQKHQTIDEVRLYSDLLSSMPLCFNLFGPLATDPELAAAVVRRWFPDRCPSDARVKVQFEWSPGRADDQWLGDRTAFDAVIFVETANSCSLIGVETKYHEHPTRATRAADASNLPVRYREVTERAELFDDENWESRVWGQPVEQLWRDHLLALACEQHSEAYAVGHYVLAAPAANPCWSELAAQYRALGPGAHRSFEMRTIDELVTTAADCLPHTDRFRARYLDVAMSSINGE